MTLVLERSRTFGSAGTGPSAYFKPLPELGSRFSAWIGRSGTRYIVSVYTPDTCPDYENVVALVVRRERNGQRRILAAIDLGATPHLALSSQAVKDTLDQAPNEIHLHLLAADRAARARVIADIMP